LFKKTSTSIKLNDNIVNNQKLIAHSFNVYFLMNISDTKISTKEDSLKYIVPYILLVSSVSNETIYSEWLVSAVAYCKGLSNALDLLRMPNMSTYECFKI
jgi:hypothetical protein